MYMHFNCVHYLFQLVRHLTTAAMMDMQFMQDTFWQGTHKKRQQCTLSGTATVITQRKCCLLLFFVSLAPAFRLAATANIYLKYLREIFWLKHMYAILLSPFNKSNATLAESS